MLEFIRLFADSDSLYEIVQVLLAILTTDSRILWTTVHRGKAPRWTSLYSHWGWQWENQPWRWQDVIPVIKQVLRAPAQSQYYPHWENVIFCALADRHLAEQDAAEESRVYGNPWAYRRVQEAETTILEELQELLNSKEVSQGDLKILLELLQWGLNHSLEEIRAMAQE